MNNGNISLTEIKSLVKKLKKYDSQWAVNMVPKLKADKPRATLDTVYTITGGTKKSQEWRILFFEKATEYLSELKDRQAEKKASILESQAS